MPFIRVPRLRAFAPLLRLMTAVLDQVDRATNRSGAAEELAKNECHSRLGLLMSSKETTANSKPVR